MLLLKGIGGGVRSTIRFGGTGVKWNTNEAAIFNSKVHVGGASHGEIVLYLSKVHIGGASPGELPLYLSKVHVGGVEVKSGITYAG
ncbi:hypothetical protein [Thermococcus sp.]|uniref:hypothetical protein n=1 Tax=Thermococcus sp. TaxID=35749 RepID=UPI0025D6FB8F|nr:hypothetical protein [Thermococcus sp.]